MAGWERQQSEETRDGQPGDQETRRPGGVRAPDASRSTPRCSRRRLPDQALARSWSSIAGGRRRIGGWTPTVRLRKRPGASQRQTPPRRSDPACEEARKCRSGVRFLPSCPVDNHRTSTLFAGSTSLVSIDVPSQTPPARNRAGCGPSLPAPPLPPHGWESCTREGAGCELSADAYRAASLSRTPTGTLRTRSQRSFDQTTCTGPKKVCEGVRNSCWRRQLNHRIVAHVRCAPLAEIVLIQSRFQQNTAHVSTRPYTTFDHSSSRGWTTAYRRYSMAYVDEERALRAANSGVYRDI